MTAIRTTESMGEKNSKFTTVLLITYFKRLFSYSLWKTNAQTWNTRQ